jgi:hypothetical protein
MSPSTKLIVAVRRIGRLSNAGVAKSHVPHHQGHRRPVRRPARLVPGRLASVSTGSTAGQLQ